MAWNYSEPEKVNIVTAKFGIKQGGNIKNSKNIKSFKTDICKHSMFQLYKDASEIMVQQDQKPILSKDLSYLECK